MPSKATPDELRALINRARLEHRIYPGSLWLHAKSGGVYRAIYIFVKEDDLSLLVGYTKENDDGVIIWCRPLTEFVERFVPTRV